MILSWPDLLKPNIPNTHSWIKKGMFSVSITEVQLVQNAIGFVENINVQTGINVLLELSLMDPGFFFGKDNTTMM